jgi:signal transduction histidine kinase
LEFRSLRKGGVVWWTEISATNCLHIPEVQAIVVNFRDVTERRKAETERSRLMAELERKNKDLESLIYVASHDLRSPLVNKQGFGRNLQKYLGQTNDLLQSSDTLDDFRTAFNPLLENKIPSALQFIEAASTKMDILIDGLLRVSRIGRAVLQKRLVDMDLLLQEIVKSMAFQLDKAGAHVEVVSPLAGCYVDPNQINQVFSNLIDNAIKYRNPNVPLTITISSQVQDRYALYTVADTGMGIAAENQDKIWELFYRLEGEAAIPGEGLGLTISRRIVERHGGRIWVESEPGVGSRFMVELPLKA